MPSVFTVAQAIPRIVPGVQPLQKWESLIEHAQAPVPVNSHRHKLGQFGLRDMIECGRHIRSITQVAGSMEEASQILVRSFYQAFRSDASDASDCALVRCFKTQPLETLPHALRAKAIAALGHEPAPGSRCLTLLATDGDLPAWRTVEGSTGHQVIPLENAEAVERAPMIAQLIRQLGIDINAVVAPTEELLLEADERTYGVFHVEHAAGSPFIPAQHFLQQHGVRSVLGFGGLLPSGDLFAVILFAKARLSREVANLFRTLALSVKLALLPFTLGPIFTEEVRSSARTADRTPRTPDQEQTRSEIATLRLLIPALEAAALYQTGRLEDVIADLEQQQQQFWKLGARLQSTLESTSDAVFMLDREWRFTFLNQHALKLLQGDEVLLGRNAWEMFPAAESSNFGKQYRLAMETRKAVQFQEHYPAPLDRWFEVHAYPSDEGIAVFFHDVSERRKAEAALIKNEKLAAVGRLAASIAHEINNPLESVTNLLYLARTSTDPGEIQDYLATADRELRRAGTITNQTLRFHKQSTRPTEVSCEELIESILSIHHGRVVNSQVQVELSLRARRKICCFEGEIRQVLSNLIGNAIDALHPDGGRLLLRSREASDWPRKRRGIVITVADTGPGMSTQTRQKATEPFFTTKGIGGTGLGLWISREIVSRHDGRLTLRSSQRPGHTGTVISTFLPFDAVER